MSSLLGSFFASTTDQSADETIAVNGISAAAASANAYLNATLTSTTPEVRRLFSEYTTQSVMAHEQLINLSVQKDWITPYASPEQQLQNSYKSSQAVVDNLI